MSARRTRPADLRKCLSASNITATFNFLSLICHHLPASIAVAGLFTINSTADFSQNSSQCEDIIRLTAIKATRRALVHPLDTYLQQDSVCRALLLAFGSM